MPWSAELYAVMSATQSKSDMSWSSVALHAVMEHLLWSSLQLYKLSSMRSFQQTGKCACEWPCLIPLAQHCPSFKDSQFFSASHQHVQTELS